MDSGRNSVTGTAVDEHLDEDAYIQTEQARKELGHRAAEDEAQAPAGPRKFQHGCKLFPSLSDHED